MDIRIRKLNRNDLEALHELLSDPKVMQYLENPYTKEQTEQFLINAGLSDPPLVFAVDSDGSFAGYVIFHDYDEESIEIGWVLYPSYWEKGIASRLTESMIKKGSDLHKKLVIECVPEQEVTKHLALKHGFVYEGRNGGLDIFRSEG